MTNFEKIQSMNVEELSEWIDKYGQFDDSPWAERFNELYCSNCESIMCHYEINKRGLPYAWCELYNKCKFFQELDDVPDNKAVIKMWLKSE